MKIILPLSVIIPRKTKADKVFALNLNIYRNSHHFTLNAAKKLWSDVVTAAAIHATIPDKPPYVFTYTVYPNSNRKFDLGNVCSIIQKFTDDALIELGIITDDSYKVIPKVNYRIGCVDKENPRCELIINSIIAEHKPEINYNDLPF